MIEVNTLVRNGEPYIAKVLLSVLPYVDRVLVYLDDSCTDDTRVTLRELYSTHKNLEVKLFEHPDNMGDLTKIRNQMLEESTEDWVWIIDDDEVYPKEMVDKVLNALKTSSAYDLLAVRGWFLVGNGMHHRARSKAWIPRIVRREGAVWKRAFSGEMLFNGKKRLWKSEKMRKLSDIWYYHYSYLKPYSWRDERGIGYPEYDSSHPEVLPIPPKFIRIIENHERMQNL